MRNILLIFSIFIILTSCSEYLSLKSIENCATHKYFKRYGDLSTFGERMHKLTVAVINSEIEAKINEEDEMISKKYMKELLELQARNRRKEYTKAYNEVYDAIATIDKEFLARFNKSSLDNKLKDKIFVKDFEDCKKKRDKSKWSFDKKWKYW